MGCQRRIAREIKKADAEYVLALKGNQGTAHKEIESYHAAAIASKDPALAHCAHIEKGHGRIETRSYWQSTDRAESEGLRCVGVVESVRGIGDQTTTERRYYLSSLNLYVNKFANAVRSYWSVETLATLRRWALNLLKADTRKAKRSIKARIKAAGWNHAYLLHLLTLQTNLA